MALRDWLVVRPAWQARHAGWSFREQLVLAQLPTITSVSRQALVRGAPPAEFAGSLDHNREEPAGWEQTSRTTSTTTPVSWSDWSFSSCYSS